MPIDYKEIINPLILFPLIVVAFYLISFRSINLVVCSFIFFFLFSFSNNLLLILRKKVKMQYYLYLYGGLFLSLIFLVPLFYSIKLKHPFLISFFMLGLTDFTVQLYYNIFPRKNGKEIIKLWKNKLIKSERTVFHPISTQKYIFKDFITEIIEPAKINPSFRFIDHTYLISSKINNNILKHQFVHKDSIAFQLFLEKNKLKKFSDYTHNEYNITEHFNLKKAKDSKLLNICKKMNKNISNNIITAYMWRGKCRIIFRKKFVLNNPQKVYNFLKAIYKY